MKFMAGWRTMLMSILVVAIPNLVAPVEAYIAANPGMASAVIGGVFAFLRVLTKSPVLQAPR